MSKLKKLNAKFSALIFLTLSFLWIGCSNNENSNIKNEELLKIQIEDSLKVENEKNRIHNELIQAGKIKRRQKLEEILNELKDSKTIIDKEIEKINEFQFGRAQSTKENQLYEQYLNLEYVTDLISGVKNEIAYTEISKTNQANDNPNELVLYFINSIKKSDFSQLRNIIDPYGEFDQNSLSILLLSQYNEKLKSEVLNQYSNSRIITSNNLNDNETIIEIATGVNSDFIKKIIVVKRLNKWYILSM